MEEIKKDKEIQDGVSACLAAPVAGAVRGNAVSRAPLNILIFTYRLYNKNKNSYH